MWCWVVATAVAACLCAASSLFVTVVVAVVLGQFLVDDFVFVALFLAVWVRFCLFNRQFWHSRGTDNSPSCKQFRLAV